MASFSNPDGSFFGEAGGVPVLVVNPGTVASLSVTLGWRDRALFVANSGTTLGTLDVKLPMTVEYGEKVEIGVGANVGTLSVTDGFGNAVSGAPTSINAGSALEVRNVGIAAGQTAAVGWIHWR